jgi:hypothetical protein
MKDISQPNVSEVARPLVSYFRKDPWIWVTVAILGLLRVALAGRYDAFRNELYFIVCGRHLDFGFVDQPPLVPFLAAMTQLWGDNVWLLRLPRSLRRSRWCR